MVTATPDFLASRRGEEASSWRFKLPSEVGVKMPDRARDASSKASRNADEDMESWRSFTIWHYRRRKQAYKGAEKGNAIKMPPETRKKGASIAFLDALSKGCCSALSLRRGGAAAKRVTCSSLNRG